MAPSYALNSTCESVVSVIVINFFSSANVFDLFFFNFETSLAHSGEKSGGFVKFTKNEN